MQGRRRGEEELVRQRNLVAVAGAVRSRAVSAKLMKVVRTNNGEVSERFKEHAWKACVGEILPWVQIPPSPPYSDVQCYANL